jgi:hypothetical protein
MRSRISSALIAVGSLGGLLVAAVVIYGYTTSPGWVGVANKTLWDWLELVIVPIVIAAAGFLLSIAAERERQLEQRERELFQQSERAQDSALQAFLDQLSHSDTYRELRTAPASGRKRAVQRAKMQTLLMQLNGPRKGVLLSFLHGAKLTRKKR